MSFPSVETISVISFTEYLSKHPDPYADCDVISVTHSKNLNSYVLHEYLHIIIRHRPSNRWRRLLVERQLQDQVIIGFWPWVAGTDAPFSFGISGSSASSGSSSGGGVPLPLLMRNLRFDSLNLQSVAKILLEVHLQHPKYNIITANCYWYSDTVFQIIRGVPGAQYHEWEWIAFRAKPFAPSKAKALAFRLAAAKFLDEMKNQPLRLESQVGEAPAEIEVEGSRLPDQHSMYDVFPKVLQSPGVPGEGEASVIEIQDRLEEFADAAILKATLDRKADINGFSKEVLADPEKETNLAFYESCLSKNKTVEDEGDPYTQDSDREFISKLVATVTHIGSVNAPSKEEEARYEEATRVFAGGILRKVLRSAPAV